MADVLLIGIGVLALTAFLVLLIGAPVVLVWAVLDCLFGPGKPH